MVVDAINYQDLPFEKLVEELQPERNLNHTPLFQVMLNVFLLNDAQVRVPGLTIETLTRPGDESNRSRHGTSWKQRDDLCVDLRYNADLSMPYGWRRCSVSSSTFSVRSARRLIERSDRFRFVTEASRHVLPDPTVALSEPWFAPVTSEFLARVRQSPEQTAVTQTGHSWTYSELAVSAEAIARALLACHLEREDVVAVMGPRSFGSIASVVGAFMSGGVLLMVDRSLPVNRQRFVLVEGRARCLVYVGEWRSEDDWLREISGLEIIAITKEGALKGPPPLLSLPEISPNDPAYIFFTSGTTGIPKGVRGVQKGLSHFLAWQRTTFAIAPDDRCAQLTGPSFEVILRDIFLPLVSGATLCLPDEITDAASDSILPWMDREGVTMFHAVPTLAQTWLDAMAHGAFPPKLRWAFFGGEPLSDVLVARWRKVMPQTARIVNLYGPAETTLAKCFEVVPDTPPQGTQHLGKPLPQTQALVLNDGQLCGVGEPGEIVIRTPFRTFGYINAPEEQQKRFLKNPFRNDPEDLIYLTGDRGRYRPDGVLEFLGRIDDQVKIRGVRIEPAEVTVILGRHPKVKACFVMAVKDASTESILAAYVVPAAGSGELTSELRSYLSEHLPRVMVPSAFVFLDALPVTSNGKVDRRALLALDLTKVRARTLTVPPRHGHGACDGEDPVSRAGARAGGCSGELLRFGRPLTSGDPGRVADTTGVQRRASIEHDLHEADH